MKRPVGFHLTLLERDRELLDRLAREQGVSRTELIARSLHCLESKMHPPTMAIRLSPAPTHPDLISGKE